MTAPLFFQVIEQALLKGKEKLRRAIRMTKREKEIILLIADGVSNKQIASSLNIATFTVKSHVHNILEKLHLHSRLQIANYSRDEETLEFPSDRPSKN
jgi:DNA-binding NarL/FixJ family response regulator